MDNIIDKINQKYTDMKQDPNIYLTGLYHAKAITYWDYIQVETLLSLQRPRTNFPDEEIFIIYHQITELVLKLIRHEIDQITSSNDMPVAQSAEKMERVNRYTGLLINSFSIMSEGMSYEDYNEFRLTLTPASGLQSAQFRFLELSCTDVSNLLNRDKKEAVSADMSIEALFTHIYWKEAGTNPSTGEKSLTLKMFEDKYEADLIAYAYKMKDCNLMKKVEQYRASGADMTAMDESLRRFDRYYNIKWPLVHLETANTYLAKKGEPKRATGSSNWQKYLHPAYQQRKFFPNLWTSEEIANWAKEFL